MDIIQKLLHRVIPGIPSPRRPSPLQRPSLNTPEQWQAYWEAQGQSWRREPEIDLQRQAELTHKRAIVPDIEQGIYPFKGAKLSRADVEWLLTTHENGRGPVDWNDESQREREGLDLRGADLRSVDLTGLPLAKTVGGLNRDDFADLSAEQLEAAVTHLESADLKDAHLQGANLSGAHLQEADLAFAHLEQADLLFTHLEGANLNAAYLEGANLFEAHLEQVTLFLTHLEGVNLHSAHLEGATLCDAFFDINTRLGDIVLGDKVLGNVRLADVHWGGVNISNVDWSTINMLGDELFAREYERTSNTKMRLDGYQVASRANRQLATVSFDT